MKSNRLDGKIVALAFAVVSLGICYGAICDSSDFDRSRTAADPVSDGSADASIASLWDLNAGSDRAFNISDVGTGDAALLAGEVQVPLTLVAPELNYRPVYALGRPVMTAQFEANARPASFVLAMDAAPGSSDGEQTAMLANGSSGQADTGEAGGSAQERTTSSQVAVASDGSEAPAAAVSSFAPPMTAGYQPSGVQTLSGSFYGAAPATQSQARAAVAPVANQPVTADTVATSTTQVGASTASSTTASVPAPTTPTTPLIGNLSGTMITEVNPANSDFGGTLGGAFVKTATLVTDTTSDPGSTTSGTTGVVVDAAVSVPVPATVTVNLPTAQIPDRGGTWALLGIGLGCLVPFALKRKDGSGVGGSR